MKRLREKLNSRNGASILLALLFFLLCMMVAASILMAAVSNAGKIRSNYEEQQKYLALSSALRLICGELEQAEYQGNVKMVQWTELAVDQDGEEFPIYYYRVCQEQGSFTCGELANQSGDAAPLSWVKVIPLLEELDDILGEEASGSLHDSLYDPSRPVSPKTHTLTLTVDATSPFNGTALREELKDITLTVQMNRSRRIHLTATLEDSDGKIYSMEAELSASVIPTVHYTAPAGEYLGIDPPNSAVRTPLSIPLVTWKLDWIAKEQAGETEAGG